MCVFGGALRQPRSFSDGHIGVLLHGGRQLFHAVAVSSRAEACCSVREEAEVGITGVPHWCRNKSHPNSSRTCVTVSNQRALHMRSTVPASSPISLRPRFPERFRQIAAAGNFTDMSNHSR